MVRIFCTKRDADALMDGMSKMMRTTRPTEQAAIATPAIAWALCASTGSGLGSLDSAAIAYNHEKLYCLCLCFLLLLISSSSSSS